MTADDPQGELDSIVRLISFAGRLKRLRRQGWIDRGVSEPESVADHSFRLALLTLVVGTRIPGIDVGRAVRLALIHDLPEAIAGDVTPFDDGLKRDEVDRDALFREIPTFDPDTEMAKTAAERSALNVLTSNLPGDMRNLLTSAWEEYESGKTPEARLVRQLDKLETWLQALEYRAEEPELIIESFRRGTERDVTDDDLVAVLNAINRAHDETEL